MKICKLLLATSGASVLLVALVAGASARNLSVSNQSISGMWSSFEFNLPGATTRCHITLEGSLHSRTMAKVSGSLMGYITRATLGPCLSFTVTILRETLPWHVRYAAFRGTLPNIDSIIVHLTEAAWRVREERGTTCLARSEAGRPVIITFHRNAVSREITEAGISGRIPYGFECFGIEGTFRSDSGAVSLLGTQNVRISVSLI